VPHNLNDVATPGLLLDLHQFDRNIERLGTHLRKLSPHLKLRPHMKTLKSVELGRRLTDALGTQAITVSTLAEAEAYAKAGYRDILYAVGLAPAKLGRVARLLGEGVDCQVVTDNVATAKAIGAFASKQGVKVAVLIEIDCDGHRAGVKPDDSDQLVAIAEVLGPVAELRGVMTHGGGSYGLADPEALKLAADQEADSVRRAATILREAGFAAPVTSVGSSPTALADCDRSGITELRAGVFPFFDLVMAGIGVCLMDEIALSVVTTVIGHQADKGWILCDAGWMALSRDRSTQGQRVDYAYGQVCDAAGVPFPDLVVHSTNQEHGIIALREGARGSLPDIPVGTQLRILPNHACATAAQHAGYNVMRGDTDPIEWVPRFGGW
jgi:D-serine deaminase-like pyridoxal phosphate-dependent protein